MKTPHPAVPAPQPPASASVPPVDSPAHLFAVDHNFAAILSTSTFTTYRLPLLLLTSSANLLLRRKYYSGFGLDAMILPLIGNVIRWCFAHVLSPRQPFRDPLGSLLGRCGRISPIILVLMREFISFHLL